MDLEDKIILIYCICDDSLQALGRVDDPQCLMASAEVMTTAIVAATYHYGNIYRSREFLLVHGYVPSMLSTCQLYRRWHRIPEEVWHVVMMIIAKALQAISKTEEYAIDSFPVPACQPCRSRMCRLYSGTQFLGYCKSKRLHYYGLKVHLVVDCQGVVIHFSLTPASHNDVRALWDMANPLPPNTTLYADKAYSSYSLEDLLAEYESIELAPLRRHNLKRQHSFEKRKKIITKRRIVETAISAIQTRCVTYPRYGLASVHETQVSS